MKDDMRHVYLTVSEIKLIIALLNDNLNSGQRKYAMVKWIVEHLRRTVERDD